MAELTVVACPEKHLAYTNYVYVSPDEAAVLKGAKPGKAQYVQINGTTVYTVEPHSKINIGELGLSAFQRETLKVAQAARISVKPWALPVPAAAANLVRISMSVEMIGQGRKSATEKELAEHINNTFNNAVFNVGQIFVVDFIGTPLKLTVKDLSIPAVTGKSSIESDSITARAERGVFISEITEIDIDADVPNKFFTFVKEKKKQLLPNNFRFEDLGIGGLDAEFNLLFRRAFASRIFPAKLVNQLGIKHVKGMLLYGPPGTGKVS